MELVYMRSSGWALIQYDWYLIKKRKFGHRLADRTPGEDEGRDQVPLLQAKESQGQPRTANKPAEARGKHGAASPLQPTERTSSAHTLISDLWLPEL